MHTIIIEPCSVPFLSHELRLNIVWLLAAVYIVFFIIYFSPFFIYFLIICCRVSRGLQLDLLQVPIESVTEFKAETETETRARLSHNTSALRCVHYELQYLHNGISTQSVILSCFQQGFSEEINNNI